MNLATTFIQPPIALPAISAVPRFSSGIKFRAIGDKLVPNQPLTGKDTFLPLSAQTTLPIISFKYTQSGPPKAIIRTPVAIKDTPPLQESFSKASALPFIFATKLGGLELAKYVNIEELGSLYLLAGKIAVFGGLTYLSYLASSKLYDKIETKINDSYASELKKLRYTNINKLAMASSIGMGTLTSFVLIGGSLNDIWKGASYTVPALAAFIGFATLIGAKDSITNLVAAIKIKVQKKFAVGDEIQIENSSYKSVKGRVLHIGLFETTILDLIPTEKIKIETSPPPQLTPKLLNQMTLTPAPVIREIAVKDLDMRDRARDAEKTIIKVPNQVMSYAMRIFPERRIPADQLDKELEDFAKLVDGPHTTVLERIE